MVCLRHNHNYTRGLRQALPRDIVLDRSWGTPPRWDQKRADLAQTRTSRRLVRYLFLCFDPIRVKALCFEEPQLACISST